MKSILKIIICKLKILQKYFECFTSSTAVEQVVACALVTQRARVRSPVGTGFLSEVFLGISLPVRQMSGNFRPPRSPEYHLAVVIIIPYSPCWDD